MPILLVLDDLVGNVQPAYDQGGGQRGDADRAAPCGYGSPHEMCNNFAFTDRVTYTLLSVHFRCPTPARLRLPRGPRQTRAIACPLGGRAEGLPSVGPISR